MWFGRPQLRLVIALSAVGVMLLLVGCGGSTAKSSASRGASTTGTPSSGPSSLQQSYVSVIGRVAPSVVQISTPHDLGSGVVFDAHGDVVTNAHVVASGGTLTITDSHGHNYRARLVGAFKPDDLAVVRAQGASLPAASLANSDRLHVGDVVLALGNPLGLRSSVTNGIVSALGRTVPEPTGAVLPDVIQTSAPINPGNSGGALVDLQGQVVGIPTLAARDPQLGGGAAPGIGFAIPSSLVSDIAGQIAKHGHVVNSHRAYLGVELASGASGASGGAPVVAVQSRSPAAAAGIVRGELITAINGHPIQSATDVANVLTTLAPGQTVPVAVTKPDGSHATVKIKLGKYPGGG